MNMFGYDLEEGFGRSLWDYIKDENRVVVEKNMEKWLDGIIETYELELTCKDGSSIWTLINSKPLFDKSGKDIGVLAMITDITEWKKANEKLRESEEKYRNIVETANEGIGVIDTELKLIYVNKKTEELSGYSCEEIIGKKLWDFISEESKPIVKSILKEGCKILKTLKLNIYVKMALLYGHK
jgi:PAS domain S-box-containing protein